MQLNTHTCKHAYIYALGTFTNAYKHNNKFYIKSTKRSKKQYIKNFTKKPSTVMQLSWLTKIWPA